MSEKLTWSVTLLGLMLVGCDAELLESMSLRGKAADSSDLNSDSGGDPSAINFNFAWQELTRPEGVGEYLRASRDGFLFQDRSQISTLSEQGVLVVGTVPANFLSKDQVFVQVPVVESETRSVSSWAFLDDNNLPQLTRAVPGYIGAKQVLQRLGKEASWRMPVGEVSVIYADERYLWLREGGQALWYLHRHDHQIGFLKSEVSKGRVFGVSQDYLVMLSDASERLSVIRLLEGKLMLIEESLPVAVDQVRVAFIIRGHLVIFTDDGAVFAKPLEEQLTWLQVTKLTGAEWLEQSLVEAVDFGSLAYLHLDDGRLFRLQSEASRTDTESMGDVEASSSAKLESLAKVLEASCSGCHGHAQNENSYELPIEFDYRQIGHWRLFLEKEGFDTAKNVILNDMCHRSQTTLCSDENDARQMILEYIERLRSG